MNKIVNLKKDINVLSLFDGMACGYTAFKDLGFDIKNYYAYEIDKYAIKTTLHNFPDVKELGNVFDEDFSVYKDKNIDWLVFGSPCTFWSIAQNKNKRETTANGLGWNLFMQGIRALNEVKPKYFLYENNKSMSRTIYNSISDAFGFEPIMINAALVSAQNRQRYYWVGKLNNDGTYSKVDIKQPEDRGILLKDVLDGVTDREKGRTVIGSTGRTTEREYFKKFQGNMSFEPVGTTKEGKSYCLTQGYSNGSGENIGNYVAHTLEKGCKSMVVEPVACRCRGRKDENGNGYAKYECRDDCKSNTLDTNFTNGNMVAEPVDKPIRIGIYPTSNGRMLNSQGMRIYSIDGKSVTQSSQGGGMGAKTGLYAIPVYKELTENEMDYMMRDYSDRRWNFCQRPAQDDKSKCLVANVAKGVPYNVCAIPVEFENESPTKAISYADGKTYKVYEVKDGQITIKEKQYPIKLQDGYYIIRKLTVSECKRLQTVPEWYEFPVSDTQAYKMLGNGWCVEVIKHLINETYENELSNDKNKKTSIL